MIDLATAEFQASTLTYEQLRLYVTRSYQAWQEALGTEYSRWLETLYKIYLAALQAKIDVMITRLQASLENLLIIRTEISLYWFAEDQGYLVRPVVLEELFAGNRVWWDDGTEQWVVHEPRVPPVYHPRSPTFWLVDRVLYTLRDGSTTSVVYDSIWEPTPTP
ncbi:MAG: hypothetical protein ACTSUU_06805 [Candidatus Thorarchaeota archaeon]